VSAARRVTITDVAREAGVSIGAVSNSVNGRKGVSEATRARVLEVAARLGWTPDAAARSLTGGRTSTVAVLLGEDIEALSASAYFASLVAGVESVLTEHGLSLQLQTDPVMDEGPEPHRRWLASRQVDGLILVDLRSDDPRVEALAGVGSLSAVAVSDPEAARHLPYVWADEAAAMRETVGYLGALGHRRIALMDYPADRATRAVRDAAFAATCAELEVQGDVVDIGGASGGAASATRRLLTASARPTALIFDGTETAVAGLGVAMEMGVAVPRDLSIVGWYDSPLLQATFPAFTAVGFDAREVGDAAARMLLGLLGGGTVDRVHTIEARLAVRGTTAPPSSSG
jgi:DNA-binding LacI/PurR family transcriptional regulator